MTDAQETLTRLLTAHGHHARSVRPLGAGLDHAAFDVDGELVARLSTHPDRAERAHEVEREARLLHRVAAVSPLPVPEPVHTDPDSGWLTYRKLPGEPLLHARDPARHAMTAGAALGGLLATLHAQGPEDWAELVHDDDTPPSVWLQEAHETFTDVAVHVPPSHRGAVEAFLHAAPPPAAPRRVLSHNDLGIEHVLIDPGTGVITGVIDWSDAALVDPACDLGRILRDLGDDGLEAALAAIPAPPDFGLRARVTFYARCGLLEDLAHGVATGKDVYTRKSLTALPRLFPSPGRGRRG